MRNMAMKDAAEEIVEMALESRVTKAMPLFDITPTPSLFDYNTITKIVMLHEMGVVKLIVGATTAKCKTFWALI